MAADSIRLIAGLGNPGPEYATTRHNVGFWFVDQLAAHHGGQFRPEAKFQGETCRISLGGQVLWLLKPMTFMNRSGQSLGAMANYFQIRPQEILIAHDELDLAVGIARFKQGGGAAGHNGLRNILAHLPDKAFWRLRIGIGRPAQRQQTVGYVLSRPPQEERMQILRILDEAETALSDFLAGEVQKAMNRLHAVRPE